MQQAVTQNDKRDFIDRSLEYIQDNSTISPIWDLLTLVVGFTLIFAILSVFHHHFILPMKARFEKAAHLRTTALTPSSVATNNEDQHDTDQGAIISRLNNTDMNLVRD